MTDLIWTPIKIRLGQIIPWSDNPRMSTKAQAQRLIKSERELGQIQTLAVSPFEDGKVYLYDGHQRCAAWMTVKDPSFEVTALQSNRMLTDDERKKVSVLLHTATGSWSWEALSSWSAADLREWGMDEDTLKGWNNDANNLKEMLNAGQDEPVDAEPQIDRAAELAEKWHTATGQLWKLGEHRLLIGDCTVRENVERLMGGEFADCVWTDPPYGVEYKGGAKVRDEIENDDDVTTARDALLCIIDFVKSGGVIYCAAPPKRLFEFWELFIAAGYRYSTLLVWVKNNMVGGWGDYRGKYENILYGWKDGAPHYWCGDRDKTTIFKYDKPSVSLEHPTMKPVELVQEQINNSTVRNEIVLEPFGGSGTTIIAAHNLNRRCYACEISPNYGGVILERFYTATGITPELVE